MADLKLGIARIEVGTGIAPSISTIARSPLIDTVSADTIMRFLLGTEMRFGVNASINPVWLP